MSYAYIVLQKEKGRGSADTYRWKQRFKHIKATKIEAEVGAEIEAEGDRMQEMYYKEFSVKDVLCEKKIKVTTRISYKSYKLCQNIYFRPNISFGTDIFVIGAIVTPIQMCENYQKEHGS